MTSHIISNTSGNGLLNQQSISFLGGGLPPPDLLYHISNSRSAENYLPKKYLKSPQNSSLLTLITLNSVFKHISFIHTDAYKKRINESSRGKAKLLKAYDFDHIVSNMNTPVLQ